MAKTWLITGASRGFGKEWATAALERGDQVAATVRDLDSLKELSARFGDRLLPLELDVTSRRACFAAVDRAHDKFGRLDIVVNNAGYGQFGMVEELSEEDARAQIETNLFGTLWITQASLPHLRKQKSGHIIQVSSIGGIVAFPGLGMYHPSKWALEGYSQALAAEVESFGIYVTLVEPGAFSTDWSGASAKRAEAIAAYDELKAQIAEVRKTRWSNSGDPKASARAILQIVDAKQPPLRVFFGAAPIGMAKDDYAKRVAEWEAWDALSKEAQG